MKYSCFGHFYKNNLVTCRSVLLISKKPLEEISSYDLVAVMMNPGSSVPLETDIKDITATYPTENISDLVPTKPDDTQFQIMEVMSRNNLSTACIINLSDVRDADSSKFISSINKLEHSIIGNAHSIFSVTRKMELKKILKKSCNCPVIIASGVNYKLRFLTNNAVNHFKPDLLIGNKKENGLYYHALPRLLEDRVKWVNEILHQLERKLSIVNRARKNDTRLG